MPTLLQLDSSPLASSISRELTREFAKTWKDSHAGGTVIHRDLAVTPLKPIDSFWVGAVHTQAATRTPEQEAALVLSSELIKELETADEYVIGVAMHNFSIPSVLKLWIDQIVRAGHTFSYETGTPVGLLQGKKATVLIASGGVYGADSPMASFNHIDPYLKTILGFIGVTDITFVAAAGASRLMTGAIDRETFLKPTLEVVRSVAA
jgi:FMN-dependent NADH-azoreductase